MKFYISCLLLLFCQFQSNNTAANLCKCGENEGDEHSWHTLLYMQDGSGDFKPLCNGILISPWHVITVHTCIKMAKKDDSDSAIQVGIGDLSQHNIAAKMIDFRENVAILELERRVDFANSACLGKPSLGTFIFTTISNDSKSILINDGASIDDNHCSPRKNKDKCFKIQDGLSCTTLLGGPLLQFDRKTNQYSVVGLATSEMKKKCHLNHEEYVTFHPLTASTINWILDQIGNCHCPYCKVDREKLECNSETISGEFPKDMFVQCPNIKQEVEGIKTLQMDHQKITKLALDDFKHFPNAVFVDFSDNQIKEVDFTVGNQVMPRMRKFKLKRNKISKLPEGSLDTDRFPRLQEIDLRSNPIKHYTTLSWPFCYAHTHSMKDNPVIGKVTFHKFYGYDYHHLKDVEESFCEELTMKGKRHIKECVKEDEKTMDCTDLDLGTEDINSLYCFVDRTSEDSVLILKFPKDETLHLEDNLEKCNKIDISKTLLSDAAKFNQIKEVVTIQAITFELSKIFEHVNLNFTKEVIIRADTVILKKPIEIFFKLKIRARKVILRHPIKLVVHVRNFKELTDHLFIERHIKYSEKTFSRQRKYALIDIVDSVPKNYKSEGQCKPETYAPEDLKDDDDWYDVMSINLMYICAHTLMKGKLHDQSEELATWHFEFNELRMNQGKVSPFATSEKFQRLLHYMKHPTLHRVPAMSLESITKLSLILKDSFGSLDDDEKFLKGEFSKIQNTMEIVSSQLSIAEDGFESYYQGQLQNLEQLFNSTDTVIGKSEESMKILLENITNEAKKSRDVLSDKLEQSTKIIQDDINNMTQHNMVAFIAIVNMEKSNYENNLKVHQDMIDGSSLDLKGCKALILKTRTKLDKGQENLKKTIERVKTAMTAEAVANAAKAFFQVCIAYASGGAAGDMDATQKLEKAAKMIDLIVKLAKIIKDMIEGILDTDEFKSTVDYQTGNATLPTDFLKAIQEANKARNDVEIFDKLKSEGDAMYNEISASSTWAPSKDLKVDLDYVVNQGKTLVSETIRYSKILVSLRDSKNKKEVSEKGKKLGEETMHNFNTTLHNLKDESKKDPIKLTSAKEYEEVLSEIKPTDFLNNTNSAKMEFKKKILQSLEKYRNEYKMQEQTKRQEFFKITEIVAASVHQTKIESTTQRLMLQDLFNDYCDAKFYTTFKACNESMTPDISTDYRTFAKRITDMNIDEHLASRVDTDTLDQYVIVNDTKSSKDISLIDIFKRTKSVDLRLVDFMDSITLKRYYRFRVSSVYVQPIDEFGQVIYNSKVRIQVIYPAKFTDTNKDGQKYEFVIQPNSCYSEYDKPRPSDTHEKKRPCKINPEEAVSPNGTFTFTILDYEIDMERVSSLQIEIVGKYSNKEPFSRSGKKIFRHKKIAKSPT